MGRPRKQTIETPGSDEKKQIPPTAEQLQSIVVQQTPPPAGDSFVEQIVEEAHKGNVVTVQQGSTPQIGAEWAGMILTEHGWASKPTLSQE